MTIPSEELQTQEEERATTIRLEKKLKEYKLKTWNIIF